MTGPKDLLLIMLHKNSFYLGIPDLLRYILLTDQNMTKEMHNSSSTKSTPPGVILNKASCRCCNREQLYQRLESSNSWRTI